MGDERLHYPPSSVRCQPGDYIVRREIAGSVRVFQVEDLVRISRLVLSVDDMLIDQELILDSERPAYSGEIYLLVTAYDGDFASPEEALRALHEGKLKPGVRSLCRDIGEFPAASCCIFRRES